MREASEAKKIQRFTALLNLYIHKDSDYVRGAIEEIQRRDSHYKLPRHISTAVDAVNMINSNGMFFQMRTGRQYGKRAILETVNALLDTPIPPPEPRNWYREYLSGFLPPRKIGPVPDPLGDLIAMEKFLKNPTPEQLAARQLAVDYFLYGPERPDKFREAGRGIKGRWQS